MAEPLQLEWVDAAPGLWRADHPLGSYWVDLRGWRGLHSQWTFCVPVEAAQAAAQADFAARVRACYPSEHTPEKE